jgi:hypothetical protein
MRALTTSLAITHNNMDKTNSIKRNAVSRKSAEFTGLFKFRCEPDLWERFCAIAKKRHSSPSNLARMKMWDYVNAQEAELRIISSESSSGDNPKGLLRKINAAHKRKILSGSQKPGSLPEADKPAK